MGWILMVWTLAVSGGVEVERTWWPTLEACRAYRETVAWRHPGRADGTGTLVGACRPTAKAPDRPWTGGSQSWCQAVGGCSSQFAAGQVRPIAWSPSWGWLTGHPVNREPLLSALRTSFPRLDLVVEYPFGGSQGAWVTLGGCLASGTETRSVRKFLYAQKGVAVVFDNTSRTPKDPLTPGYVNSVCSSDWMHDGRQVARWLITPRRADSTGVQHTLGLIKDADHRARVVQSIEQSEALEARGLWALSSALREIHKVLYQPMWHGITPQERLSYAKMMFDVWARMPAPGTEE